MRRRVVQWIAAFVYDGGRMRRAWWAFMAGAGVTVAARSLRQDYAGSAEAWCAELAGRWVDATITVPIAIAVLVASVLMLAHSVRR